MSKNSIRRKKQEAIKAEQRLLKKKQQPQKTQSDFSTQSSQQVQNPPESTWWKKLQTHPGGKAVQISWKFVGWLLGALALVIGLISFLYPKISVEPVVIADSKNPLTTRFQIKNEGELSIYDITDSAIWIPLEHRAPVGTFIFYNTNNSLHKLASGISFVTHYDEFPIRTELPPEINYQIQLNIGYRPQFWLWNKTNTFEFTASRGKDGNFFLTHSGGGKSPQSFIANPTAY